MVFATVACGGSVPPQSPPPQSPAVDSPPQASGASDAAKSAEGGKADESSAGAEAAVKDKASLGFRLSPDGNLLLNDVTIPAKAKVAELAERLGPPTREKEHPRGEKSLYHDKQGFVLWTVNGELMGVGINFNWDGDEKFPETPFTGSLALGDLKVDRNTTKAQLESLKGYSVSCLGDAMCGGKSGGTKLLVGFEKGAITQVGFMFAK